MAPATLSRNGGVAVIAVTSAARLMIIVPNGEVYDSSLNEAT
jgi:hypothetical protein